jgi:predicted nucleic acid-binding protein
VIHVDTCFLVDLLRESARGEEGPARRKLLELGAREIVASVHVACELCAGAELAGDPAHERTAVAALLDHVRLAFPDERFAPTYARLYAVLERRGERASAMDLLIATAAVVDGAPLLTRNVKHFQRVPELEVVSYAH